MCRSPCEKRSLPVELWLDYRRVSVLPLALHHPDDPQQDHRSKDRGEQGEPPSAAGGVEEEAEQEATDQGADDTDDDVHQNARAAAFDDLARDPPGDRADDDVPDPANAGQSRRPSEKFGRCNGIHPRALLTVGTQRLLGQPWVYAGSVTIRASNRARTRSNDNGRPVPGSAVPVVDLRAQPAGIIPGAVVGSTGTPTPTGGRPGALFGAGGAFGSAGAPLGSAGGAFGSGGGGAGGLHGRIELVRAAAAPLSTGWLADPSQTTNHRSLRWPRGASG